MFSERYLFSNSKLVLHFKVMQIVIELLATKYFFLFWKLKD